MFFIFLLLIPRKHSLEIKHIYPVKVINDQVDFLETQGGLIIMFECEQYVLELDGVGAVNPCLKN